ncbi:hypothetical protein HY450_02660 [Candidatus Pacearchaeota archaeon]|nr:hypothetical protein [Candidatus Pacearchaeota archaeon]
MPIDPRHFLSSLREEEESHTDEEPERKHSTGPISNFLKFGEDSSLLRRIGMHNIQNLNQVGISSDVIRPKSRKLGQYFREGYKPFVDNGRYYLVHSEKERVLFYNPKTKLFEETSLKEIQSQ